MERMYQRTKIQEESLLYESRKHSGELPIVGVNTFLDPSGSPTIIPAEIIRSAPEEREFAIRTVEAFRDRNREAAGDALNGLRRAALENTNTFDSLMETAKVCSLGEISSTLYQVGGQYRRSM